MIACCLASKSQRVRHGNLRMSTPIRVGIVGAGFISAAYLKAAKNFPELAMVSCADAWQANAEKRGEEFGLQVQGVDELLQDKAIDLVLNLTTPQSHVPVSSRALEAGKHVLTEARLSLNAAEAREMLEAARKHPNLVTQVVPSPFGLKGHDVLVDLLKGGYVGTLREVEVCHRTGGLADPAAPLSWRQDAGLSGVNMLAWRTHSRRHSTSVNSKPLISRIDRIAICAGNNSTSMVQSTQLR